MPLKSGDSREIINENIRELMDSWRNTGKIGNIVPKDEAHARRIAVAAALRKAGIRRRAGKSVQPRDS